MLVAFCIWSCQAEDEPQQAARGDRTKRFLFYKKSTGLGFGLGAGPKGAIPAMTMVGVVEQPVPVAVGVPEYPSYAPPAYAPPPYSPPDYSPPPYSPPSSYPPPAPVSYPTPPPSYP